MPSHADDRADVDDAAVPSLHHSAQDSLRQSVRRFEVGVQDRVPLVVLHAHQQVVTGDAGVVDQNRYFAETRLDVGDGLADGFGVGDIELHALALPLTLYG